MNRILNFGAAGLLAIVLATSARAATTFTWTGLGADDHFNTPGNWQGNVAPAGNATDNLFFPQRVFYTLNTYDYNYNYYSAQLTAPLAVGTIDFQANYNWVTIYGAGSLTLNGNVGANSNVSLIVPLVLTAGSHTYVGSAYVFQSGVVSGPGGITKDDSGALVLFGTVNTYTGGTILNSGSIWVDRNNSLGTGTVRLNGGILATSASGPDLQLLNNFVLGTNVTFQNNRTERYLTLGSSSHTVAPATGVSAVNLYLASYWPLVIAAPMVDGAGPTGYTFANDFESLGFLLSGNNTYTGGTLVKSGARVDFTTAGSIPATGFITVESGGYAGLSNGSVSPAAFVSRFHPGASTGTIGFDDNSFSGNINLSAFTAEGGALSIGTQRGAMLTGAITPFGSFNFKNSGYLFLAGTNPLTGGTGLSSSSFPDMPRGLLILSQSVPNTYAGATTVDRAAIVFDSAGSMPATTNLQLLNGGYISFTNTSGYTMADLVGKISSQTGATNVLGIDTHNTIYDLDFNPFTYSNDVDFSNRNTALYLGTTSNVVVSGNISTTGDGTHDYYLTGYNGGNLKVTSQLVGSRQLHVGLPGASLDSSTVELTNTGNSYTGGTVLNSGTLIASNPLALGTGSLTVNTAVGDYSYTTVLVTSGTLANNINLQAGTLDLDADGSLALSGVISGTGGLSSSWGPNFTFNGNNTYSGGSFFSDRINVTAATNTALGSGHLGLDYGARVMFTSSAPTIGSLLLGETFDDNDGFVVSASLVLAGGATTILTVNQVEDGEFGGVIVQSGSTGSLVKNGAGALTIGGYLGEDNVHRTPYSGGTTINAGTLVAGSVGALGSGSITLNGGTLGTGPGVVLSNVITFGASGGSLTGTGTFGTPISVGTGVTLAPGSSPGTLTFAAGLTLAPGGLMNFDVQFAGGVAGADYDTLVIAGGTLNVTATSGSPFTLRLISSDAFLGAGDVPDFNAASGYSWVLATGNTPGGITNFAANKFVLDTSLFTNPLAGGTFSLQQGLRTGSPALFLNFTPVPEPATYALMALGAGAVILLRRRRR